MNILSPEWTKLRTIWGTSVINLIVNYFVGQSMKFPCMMNHLVNHFRKSSYKMNQIVNHRGNYCDEPYGELLCDAVYEH